ncbi:uncharacterized protein [Dermacentor albipictus]|uniref:uncharacterized protein isoform X1 n=1 Tax=Dermacentor albipictus TaxID=60249 RepID=UPI0038FC76C4
MCICETAFEITVLGICSLIKNFVLLKASLGRLITGPGSTETLCNCIYYAVSVGMAVVLIIGVVQGNKAHVLRYIQAARIRATVDLCWKILTFCFATGSNVEFPSEETKVGAGDSRNTTTTGADLLVEMLALSMVVAVMLMVLLIEVSYKWFIIWRIEAYAANMPD